MIEKNEDGVQITFTLSWWRLFMVSLWLTVILALWLTQG